MPNYGIAESPLRKRWWQEFVNPLGILCRDTPGVDRLGLKYADWMAGKPLKPRTPIKLRDRTKQLCEIYGVRWAFGKLGTLNSATRILGELQAAAGSSGGAVTGEVQAAEIPPEDEFDLGDYDYDLEDVSNQLLAPVDTGGTPEQSGMPGWAKITLGVTGGLVVFGGGLLAVMSMSKK